MVYISREQAEYSKQDKGLERLGRQAEPSLGRVFTTMVGEGYSGDGTFIQDVRAGFVARETGQDLGVIQDESFLFARDTGLLPSILNYDQDLENRKLSKEEYEKSDFFREDLEYVDGLTTLAASVRANTYDVQQKRRTVLGRREDFTAAATGFVGALAGGLVETKNLAITGAIGAGVTAAGAGLSAPLGALAAGTTYASRALNAGLKGYRAVRQARPIATATARSALVGGAATIPVAVTGIQNEPIFATDYSFEDAIIDVAASAALDGIFTAGGSAVKQKFFNNNATLADRQAIAEVIQAQVASGEVPNVEPMIDAVVMRNPPEYSTVNFVDEIPTVIKKGDQWVARFDEEQGLAQGTTATGRTKTEAAQNLKTKYMAEDNLPDKIVDSVGRSAGTRLRDLAIAKTQLGQRSTIADLDDALAAEGTPLSSTSQESRNRFNLAEQEVRQAQESLSKRPDSIKRRTEYQNAKSRRDKEANRLERAIRENDLGVASRLDSIKARNLSRLNKLTNDTQAQLRQEQEVRLQQYVEDVTSPNGRSAAKQFISTESFDLLSKQADQLNATIRDQNTLAADLERRRVNAEIEIERLLADETTAPRQYAFLENAKKDIDGLKNLQQRMIQLQGELASKPYTQQTTFSPDDRFYSTYETLVEAVENRMEIAPETNPNEYMLELLNSTLQFSLEDVRLREVQIVNTYKARNQQTSVFNGFLATGRNRDDAFALTIEAAANDLDRSRVTAMNTLAVAFEENGIAKFVSRLANQKNAETTKKVLEELRAINAGANKPSTDNLDAFKTAQVFKTVYDGYRQRGYEAGLRVRDLEGFIINQSWYKGSLMMNAKSPENFARMMRRPDGTWRIDVEKTFGENAVSDMEVETFLKDFYNRRTSKETDSTIMKSMDFFRGVSKSAYGRSMENREIFLRDVEDTLYTIENFGGGNLPWTMTQSVRQMAADVRQTQLFGAEVLNTHDYVMETAMESASPRERENMSNPGVFRSHRYPNTRHMLEVAALANELDDGNPKTAAMVSAANNTARAVLLQDTIISALPDLATAKRARTRVLSAAGKDIARRVSRAMKVVPSEYRDASAKSISNANAYATGSMLSHMGGGSTIAKAQNVSNWAVNATIRIGGLEPWTRWNKAREFVFINSFYANTAQVQWKDLPSSLREEALRGGLNAAQWNSLKKFTDYNPDTDSYFLDVDKLEGADTDLASRVTNMFNEYVDSAIVTPGVRERAIMRQGASTGSVHGALRSLSANLLSYPISYMTKQMGREVSMAGGTLGAASGLSLLMLYGTILGSISEVLKGAKDGSTYDFENMDAEQYRDFALRGFIRGGGGGLFGDLFNKTFMYGQDLTAGLLGGPAFGLSWGAVETLIGAGGKLADGEPDEAAAEIVDGLRNKIPFTNMVWTSWFFDNYITYPLLDYLDPDKLERLESRWEDRTEGELRSPFLL